MIIHKNYERLQKFIGDLFGGDDAPAPADIVKDPNILGQLGQTYDASFDALKKQQAFVDALAGQGGLANQTNVFNQQQSLANQLQGVANGTGPNPALAQLNQTTGNNISNQAALMAGQRGASANVGLLGRQAALQGGNIQQQAAGQGATLQAQQQLAAMQALGQQQAQLQGTATNQVQQQQAGLSNEAQQAQGLLSGIQGQLANQNAAANGSQASVNSSNASLGQHNAQIGANIVGGAVGGLGVANLASQFAGNKAVDVGADTASSEIVPALAEFASTVAYKGATIPGKAPVKGDSPKNDTVPAMLSPKEIVIPRSITMGPNAPQEAAKFVAQELAKHHTKMAHHYMSGGQVAGDEARPSPQDVYNQNLDERTQALRNQGYERFNNRPIEEQAAEDVLKDMGSAKQNQEAETAGKVAEVRNQIGAQSDADAKNQAIAARSVDLQNQLRIKAGLPPLASPTNAPIMDADIQLPDSGGTPTNLGSAPSKEGGAPVVAPVAAPQLGDNQLKALQAQQAGYGQEAKAVGDLGKKQAEILGGAQADIAEKQKDFAAHRAELDARTNTLIDDIKAQKVDPNRLIANQSTGQKIATGIGLVLGGIGGALTGQENPALKYMNKQIDDDIGAQKANLDNKNTLLNHYLRQGVDMREAEVLTKSSMLETAKLKLEAAGAMAQDPLAKARAAQASGVIGQQIGMLKDQQAARKVAIDEYSKSPDPMKLINLKLPPGTKGREEVLKEAGQAMQYAKERDNVVHAFKQVQDAYKLSNAMSPAENATKKAQLFASLAQLQKSVSGRFNLEELKGLEQQFKPNYTGDDKIKLQNLLSTLDSKMVFPHAQAAGIDLSNTYGRTTPQGQSKIQLGPAVR